MARVTIKIKTLPYPENARSKRTTKMKEVRASMTYVGQA